MDSLRFSDEDLSAFSAASHDRNPLHISEEYARRSAFGTPVVFGILQGLFGLGRVAERPGRVISSIALHFYGVAATGIDYSAEVKEASPEQAKVKLTDGVRPVLEAAINFREGRTMALSRRGDCDSLRLEPAVLERADLTAERRSAGTYSPSWQHIEAIVERAGLRQQWVGPVHVAALMWTSYLVGMELPGRSALFSSVTLKFAGEEVVAAPFEYDAHVVGFGPRGELRIAGTLSSEGREFADVKIDAFIREDVPMSSAAAIEHLTGRSTALAGKVALVTGASRGLGASMAQALALQGCTVLASYLRSRAAAEAVAGSVAGATGSIRPLQGDVADVEWCREVGRTVAREHGRLDFLVCNASPPIQSLWLEPCATERVNDFVRTSFAMVSGPVTALLPLLAGASGWCVLVSSSYVDSFPAHYPHYVAAKVAAEAVARAAALEYSSVSSLIVRPPKLLTDQTNTPSGRKGALATEVVAAKVAARLLNSRYPGAVEILEEFG